MKISLSAMFAGSMYFLSKFVAEAHNLPKLPDDPLFVAIREINKTHSHDTHGYYNLTALYSGVIPAHINYTEAVNQALTGEVGCGCGSCPCLCSYGCKGKKVFEACCDEVAGNDLSCTACSGYPDGVCIGCKPGTTLQGGLTCEPDPACIHKKLGECDLCRHGKTLVDNVCEPNAHCTHQKHGICTLCAKGKNLILSNGLCVKKTGSPTTQLDDEDELPLLEGEEIPPSTLNPTTSLRLSP